MVYVRTQRKRDPYINTANETAVSLIDSQQNKHFNTMSIKNTMSCGHLIRSFIHCSVLSRSQFCHCVTSSCYCTLSVSRHLISNIRLGTQVRAAFTFGDNTHVYSTYCLHLETTHMFIALTVYIWRRHTCTQHLLLRVNYTYSD